MYIDLGNGMKLHVYENPELEFGEVAIDLIRRDGGATPLVLAGKNYMDKDDEVHVYVYNEKDDDPIEHMFDPSKCFYWRF